MKSVSLLVLGVLFLASNTIALNVVISEVLYNPLESESGGEFIELYNPTARQINISGWAIATEGSENDAILPEGASINAHGFYLLADADWGAKKDNPEWPNADYEESITLANTNAGVALRNSSGIVDAIGWGDALEIDEDLYEGVPFAHVSDGYSIERKPGYLGPYEGNADDTNNNSNDLLNRQNPEPQNSQSTIEPNPYQNESQTYASINITAIITASNPMITEAVVMNDEDNLTEGVQIIPAPGLEKGVAVEAEVVDSDGYSDVSYVKGSVNNLSFYLNKTEIINDSAARYTGFFNMSFYGSAGNYTINLSAADMSNLTAEGSASFSYVSLAAFEIDASSLLFNSSPGKNMTIAGDKDISTTTKPTIKNLGNVLLDMQIYGTDLTSQENQIDADNIEYTFDRSDFNSTLAGALSPIPTTKDINLSYGADSTNEVSFRLSVPFDSVPGNYFGQVFLLAIS